VAAGFALAARIDGLRRRTVAVVGDGELQEGAIWEAALAAAHHGLDQLVAVVDRNRLQLTADTEAVGALEPLPAKWSAFGWAVREVDGHDAAQVVAAVKAAPWRPGRPSVLIAHTVKGYGIGAVEGTAASHFAVLSGRSRARYRAEVRRVDPDGTETSR
jgi:transketolase